MFSKCPVWPFEMVWGDWFFVVCNRYFLSAVGKGRWYSSTSLSYRLRWARLQNESLLFWFSGWRRPEQELSRNSYEYPLLPGGRLFLYAHLIQPILITFLGLMIPQKKKIIKSFFNCRLKALIIKNVLMNNLHQHRFFTPDKKILGFMSQSILFFNDYYLAS